MLIWRLSGKKHAKKFDGGYGLECDGRWNTKGRPITYCSTSPAVCLLEKLVHFENPDLIPPQEIVRYDVPDDLLVETLTLRDLPAGWRHQEDLTRQLGDKWLASLQGPLLRVPSAVVPVDQSPDANFLINHNHSAVSRITLISEPFIIDPRLSRPRFAP